MLRYKDVLIHVQRGMSKTAFERADITRFLFPGYTMLKGFFNKEPDYKQREKELKKTKSVAGDYGLSTKARQNMQQNASRGATYA